MRRRIRKKLRKKEFTEYGFLISGTYQRLADEDMDMDWYAQFMDSIYDYGYDAGGGGKIGEYSLYIMPRYKVKKRRSATEEDRDMFMRFLSGYPGILTFNIGKLTDANDPTAF